MKVKWLTLVCLLVAILIGTGCAPAKAPVAKAPAGYENIRLMGGSVGSRPTTIVMVLAAIFNKYYPEIEWSSCSASTGLNTINLTRGDIKVGYTVAAGYIDAYGWEKVPESRLRSIVVASPLTHFVFIIPEDKPWKDITEVPKGLTLVPGAAGSSTIIACEATLNFMGLSKTDFRWVPMSKGEASDAWRSGKVDFLFFAIAGAEPFLLDLSTTPRKFKIIGLTSELAAKAKTERWFERFGFESPKMGNLTQISPEMFKYDVICPQQPSFLSVRDDCPAEVAYKMAKIIDEHNAESAQMFSIMKFVTPQLHIQWAKPPHDIHPGVAKYYKEKGYLK